MADTPTVLVVRDGATPSQPRNLGGTIDDSSTFYPSHSLRADGAPVGGQNPYPVRQAGSIGVDHSANAPAGPGAATSFTFNGVAVNLLTTIAANPNRRGIEVNNTTGALVVVVLDDGANTLSATSLLPLAPGAGPFQQGGDFSPPNELGRVRIFGATGTYCYVRET